MLNAFIYVLLFDYLHGNEGQEALTATDPETRAATCLMPFFGVFNASKWEWEEDNEGKT